MAASLFSWIFQTPRTCLKMSFLLNLRVTGSSAAALVQQFSLHRTSFSSFSERQVSLRRSNNNNNNNKDELVFPKMSPLSQHLRFSVFASKNSFQVTWHKSQTKCTSLHKPIYKLTQISNPICHHKLLLRRCFIASFKLCLNNNIIILKIQKILSSQLSPNQNIVFRL